MNLRMRKASPSGEGSNPEPMRAVIGPIPSLSALEASWKELEGRARPSFFLSWHWIGNWLECLPKHVRPQLLQVEHAGRLVGLAILVERHVRRHAVLGLRSLFLNCTGDPAFDEITIEHNGFLSEAGLEAAVAKAGIGELCGQMDKWDEVVLECVREPDTVAALTIKPARWRERTRGPSHFVDLVRLREGGQDFASGLGKRTRYQLKRSTREYERMGPLAVEEAADAATATRFLENLVVLHQRHWQARGLPGSFANEFFYDFHRRLIARGLSEGVIQLLRFTAGATDLGYIYNHVYRGHVSVYQTGFNYTSNGPYDRPGVVSHVLAVEHNRRKGHAVYDFSAGDAEYKRVLSNSSATLATLVMQAPRVKLRIEDAAREVRRRLRAKAAARAAARPEPPAEGQAEPQDKT